MVCMRYIFSVKHRGVSEKRVGIKEASCVDATSDTYVRHPMCVHRDVLPGAVDMLDKHRRIATLSNFVLEQASPGIVVSVW